MSRGLSIGAMGTRKIYLLWAMGVAGVGLVLGLCASGVLVLALRGLLPMLPWLWLLARCLVVVSGMCVVVSGVLLAMGMSGRFREWVVSGLGRCGQWVPGLLVLLLLLLR